MSAIWEWKTDILPTCRYLQCNGRVKQFSFLFIRIINYHIRFLDFYGHNNADFYLFDIMCLVQVEHMFERKNSHNVLML